MPRRSAISTRLTFATAVSASPSARHTKASAAAKSGACVAGGAARSSASAIRVRSASISGSAPDEAEDDAAEAARRIWSALDIWFASGEGRSRLP